MSNNSVVKGMKFHHVALRSRDLETTLRFYLALGMKEIIRWGQGEREIVMLDIGDGGRLEIFAYRGVDYPPEGVWQHFAVEVEDVEAAYKLALSLGAKPNIEPKVMPLDDARPYKTAINVAFVEGPSGELLEFFKEIKP